MDLVLINTYSSLLSGLFMVGLGIFVFLNNPKKKLNSVFILFCLSVATWLIFTFMMYKGKSDEVAIFWDRMVYVGVVFIPVLMYHFGLIFTDSEKKNKKKLYLGYFLSFIFLILSRTDYFVADLYKYNWGAHTQARFFHHLFLLFFFFYVFLFLLEIHNYLKITREKKKEIEIRQVKYLFISFIAMNMAAYAFLAAYRIGINPIGAYWIETISVIILALAITRYHLFEIRVILTEILVGAMGLIWLIFTFLAPGSSLKSLAFFTFLLFCLFGYYLIKATREEEKRREEAERLVVQERVLREEAERVAIRESALRKKLERLNQARQQFLLSSQHYFRTPLTAIRGFLELALDSKMTKSLPDEVEKWLRGAKKGTEELKKRIEESLEISQMESGKGILELKEVQLEELVKEIIKEVKIEAEFKKLPLIFERPKTPLNKVKVDEARMREAFSNIIENAVKHTLSGKIVIKLEEVKGGEAILFSVKDTGIGIPKEELSFIGTAPFERGKGGQKISPLGKGIGLYLSRLIIESHGGKFRAESEGVDRGSTFFVELPIK